MFLLQHKRTKLHVINSFGRKIIIQGRKQLYIDGDIRLIAIDLDGSYLDFVTRIPSIFCISSPFMIKCQLLGESLKYLITIASNEDLTNVLEEQEEFNTSHGSTACLHLFVMPMQQSQPPKTKYEAMSGALIKINVVVSDVTKKSTNARKHKKEKGHLHTMEEKENTMRARRQRSLISRSKVLKASKENRKEFTFLSLSPQFLKYVEGSLDLETTVVE